ncbi:helix-turn-helix domain-containing protein [Noviherbaspirillum malthae]|jgi:transcriptional regulator with XRE-family HTH domain|uniref:helix-turn-helix domain-containing protein n=1 Tax=Noviherbaspirillum malthae TaxID=1260987 RepID=UPI00188E3DB5|nr:helix-turn-helix transcriptional regulator [Noviherbaspirillum malthae]
MSTRVFLSYNSSGSPSDPLKEIGEVVRAQRNAEQLRIDDAAALCGVSVDLFSRLENGGRVTSDRLLKVLDGLGLSVLIVSKDQTPLLQAALEGFDKDGTSLSHTQ